MGGAFSIPNPFSADIMDATAAGKALLNNGASSCQLAISSNSLSLTSPVGAESVLKFINSGASGLGGRLFEIQSSIAGTTGSLPFIFAGLEYAVNDDASNDFCVLMGHGFESNATLAAGAQWGASGIKFEQHYNPSAGTNQSETYFIHVSRRIAGGNQEYRGFSLTHQNHDRTDGTDTLLAGISADTIEFQHADFTSRATWTDAGLQMASGQDFSIAALIVTWNGTTGVMNSTAKKNQYQSTLTTDDDSCIQFSPVVNLSASKTGMVTYINPTYTLGTSADFFGHRGDMLSNRAMNTNGFLECNVGGSGAVTIANIHGFRGRLWATGGTTLSSAAVVHIRTPFVSGGTISNGYGILIEDQTSSYYAFQSGTGKFRIGGDGTANTLIGFHGATPITKQTVTGSRGGNAALADLLTKLATLGLITDSTS